MLDRDISPDKRQHKRWEHNGTVNMDYSSIPNLVTMFFDRADHYDTAPFLWAKRDDTWHPITWRETAERVSALARGLRALGIEPGDRVALVAENRPEWLIADVAIMAAGAVTVPAYITNTVEDHLHILSDSGAKGAIVSTEALQKTVDLLFESAGGGGAASARTPTDDGPVDVATLLLQCRRATIYGGSSEIQRNIISKRVLNLPS